VNFEIYLDYLESLKYDVIEWCIDVDESVIKTKYFQERKYRVEIVIRVY